MSGKIMGQVWDFDLPTNEQLVLLAMADHADHIGENIYPSVGLIAWKTGYSERTIQRLIKSLLKKEILKVQKRRPGKTTIYCTAFENAPLRQPYRSEQTPDTDVTPDTIDVTPTPDIQMSPEPSLEPSTKIKDFASGDATPEPLYTSPAKPGNVSDKQYDGLRPTYALNAAVGNAYFPDSDIPKYRKIANHLLENHIPVDQFADYVVFVKRYYRERQWEFRWGSLDKGENITAWKGYSKPKPAYDPRKDPTVMQPYVPEGGYSF